MRKNVNIHFNCEISGSIKNARKHLYIPHDIIGNHNRNFANNNRH